MGLVMEQIEVNYAGFNILWSTLATLCYSLIFLLVNYDAMWWDNVSWSTGHI